MPLPLTDHELDHMAKDFACLAETSDGTLVGVSLSLPDYNQVLAKLNGRLLPLGWLTALRTSRRIDEIRVFALGVKPEFQQASRLRCTATCGTRAIGEASRGPRPAGSWRPTSR